MEQRQVRIAQRAAGKMPGAGRVPLEDPLEIAEIFRQPVFAEMNSGGKQCRRDDKDAGRHGAKLFVKQIGSNHALWPSVTGKGEDPAQWPADLRVQDFPQ